MKMEHLMYVKEVADAGSMCAAAEKLFVTQQNISKVIKQIEKSFDVQLFQRSKKGISLTEEGVKFYLWVEKQADLYLEMINKIRDVQMEKMEGVLSVITMSGGMYMIIPNMIGDYYDKFPKVELKITEAPFMDVVSFVEQGQADLGIVVQLNAIEDKSTISSESLDLLPLLDGRLYYWVSTTSFYATRGYITLSEVIKEEILFYTNTDSQLFEQYFEAKAMSDCIHIGTKSSNLYVFSQLIANGQGILPDIAFAKYQLMYSESFAHTRGITAVPLKGNKEDVSVVAIINKKKEQNPLIKITIDYLNMMVKEGQLQ